MLATKVMFWIGYAFAAQLRWSCCTFGTSPKSRHGRIIMAECWMSPVEFPSVHFSTEMLDVGSHCLSISDQVTVHGPCAVESPDRVP